MSMTKLTLTQAKKLLKYDPETGLFTWAIARPCGVKPGDRAGHLLKDGYVKIIALKKNYLAHRLAWLLSHGEWPDGQIDHIDGNKSNNRLSNLRVATPSQNTFARIKRKPSKSGIRGVALVGNRWKAKIGKDGDLIHLGYFDTPEHARRAYVQAAEKLFGEFGSHAGAFQ